MALQNLAATTASGQVNLGAFVDPAGSIVQQVSLDSSKAVYRYSGIFTLSVATPTCVILLQGGGNTARIRRIGLSGWATTAGVMRAFATRRKTAPSLGSAVLTAVTAALCDTRSPSTPTTIVSTVGTANITTQGTTAGQLAAGVVQFPVAATTTGGQNQLVWPHGFQSDAGQAWVLRGANDYISIELNGDAVPAGGVLLYEIEIEEDAS